MIVGVNHGGKFAFIRAAQYATDFYVGVPHYRLGMAIGDKVSYVCDDEPQRYNNRYPGLITCVRPAGDMGSAVVP